LVCPSGTDLETSGTAIPPTKASALGAGWSDNFDASGSLNLHFTSYYAINAFAIQSDSLGKYPFNASPLVDSSGNAQYATQKITALRPSSMVPMVFDGGLACHYGVDTEINLRHNHATLCNVVFADGHCESLRADQLPGGANGTSASNELGNPVLLDQRNPKMHWMLNQ
jgi:prepilin-type processing-associated H-X9-DG protein